MLNIRKQIINFKLQTSYFKENNYLCIRFLENRFFGLFKERCSSG